MLTDPLLYPTPCKVDPRPHPDECVEMGATEVPRRCPDSANHDAHTAVISGPNSEERPSFFNIPEETCVFMTPEGLHLDIAAAAIQK